MDNSSSASTAQAGPPATAVLHDPLPESNWLWRRIFSFANATAVAIGILLVVNAMVNLSKHVTTPDLEVNALLKITEWLIVYQWCVTTYYLIAPTGEQITRWVQTAGMLKKGVGMFSTASATDGGGSSAQTSTVAGQPGSTPAAPLPEPAAAQSEVDAAPSGQ